MSEGDNSPKDAEALANSIIKENEEVLKLLKEEVGKIDETLQGNEKIYKILKISKEDLKKEKVSPDELGEWQKKAFEVIVKEYVGRNEALKGQSGVKQKTIKPMRRGGRLRI